MLSKHKMLDNLSKKNHNMWCKRGFARETPLPFLKSFPQKAALSYPKTDAGGGFCHRSKISVLWVSISVYCRVYRLA